MNIDLANKSIKNEADKYSKIKNIFTKLKDAESLNSKQRIEYFENLFEIKEAVESVPAVEPERKKGEWIYDGIRGRFPACKCSICGHYENADWALLQGINYCPHCGADMRGE